ncbi:flotillin family protein [Parahaliea mediterranea]|uniref:Flotillin family protein n=1 Tax=Parahaliea mediterranea TaxID=651086 RepID=A0A939DGA2_9GAMM|nr:flotillin family protein [Parahaliea mediterranea]MBN7797631.1 flotillin family protein [Parahaliea mediterranea]
METGFIGSFGTIGLVAGVVFVALLAIGLIFARLYTRATKQKAFVRTGMGGEKVIKDGGAVVLPVLHEIIWVNMNTLRLEVRRANEQALITKDRMRVDVAAEFYLRVKPNADAIATAAQTLGNRTMNPDELKQLVEGKFIDALRSVAAGMTMTDLHENRANFVQEVQSTGASDLDKNGLELESVSLTGMDQTSKDFFNPDNAFDAEGLTRLTEETEARRKARNDIEQDTRISIEQKNLETETQSFEIARQQEFARLNQEREIENQRAAQQSEIQATAAQRRKEGESANIEADREIQLANIEKNRVTRESDIDADRTVREKEIDKDRAIELASQDRDIAIANKSKEQSSAKAAADAARSDAVKAEEAVTTVRETAEAERRKQVRLIEAAEQAETQAVGVTTQAEAEKQAAEDRAEAVRIEAAAQAEATRETSMAEAEGLEKINEAKNRLSPEQVDLQVRLALIERLPEIIRETVKPAEQIESIKIFDVNGLGAIGSGGGNASGGGNDVAGGIVNGMLKYQATHPLLTQMLREMGLNGVEDIHSPALSKALGYQAAEPGNADTGAGEDAPENDGSGTASTNNQPWEEGESTPPAT